MPKSEHIARGEKKNHREPPRKKPRKRTPTKLLGETFKGLKQDSLSPHALLVKEVILWQSDVMDDRSLAEFVETTPGATRQELKKILAMPTVKREIQDKLQDSVEASRPMVLKAMMKKIMRSDVKEAAKYLEVTGLHVPKKRVQHQEIEDPKDYSDEELEQKIREEKGVLEHADEGYSWKGKPEAEA